MTAVDQVLTAQGLTVFDVEKLNTHGGSLRVFAKRSDARDHARMRAVDDLLAEEAGAGMRTRSYYQGFQPKVEKIRDDLVSFLHEATRGAHRVAAYGAAAKGNTLLNYANVGSNTVEFVVDANPAKRGEFMPGSHIPIVGEDQLRQDRPGYVLILPWNLRQEITRQVSYIANWGGRFVVAIPRLEVLS